MIMDWSKVEVSDSKAAHKTKHQAQKTKIALQIIQTIIDI